MKGLYFFLLGASTSVFAVTHYDYIRIPKKIATPQWITSTGFIEDHQQSKNYLLGYLPTQNSLPGEVRDSLLTLDAKEWSHKRFDLETLKEISQKTIAEGNYESFHTYDTLTTELKSIATKYPALVTLESAGKTVQGREMWYLRLTHKKNALDSKPKLLLISSMHGDEVTGKEIMVYLIRLLTTQNEKDARITALLNNNEIFIMPSMNPDGTELHQRFNAEGVDLNRDFPLLNESPTDPNRAIEVRNIQALHEKHHFLTALNFHGGEICVNIPWDSKQNASGALFGDDALISYLSRFYADNNLPMKANHGGNFHEGVTYGYEWYPVYGGMQDWASHFYQSTHATVEISQIKWPSASSLPGFWKDNQNSLMGFLEKSTTGVHLKVTNAKNELLPVEVSIGSAQRPLRYNGYVHRPSSLSQETVTVKSAGYKTVTLNMSTVQFDGTFKALVLEK